jgi:hypothetical protein
MDGPITVDTNHDATVADITVPIQGTISSLEAVYFDTATEQPTLPQ